MCTGRATYRTVVAAAVALLSLAPCAAHAEQVPGDGDDGDHSNQDSGGSSARRPLKPIGSGMAGGNMDMQHPGLPFGQLGRQGGANPFLPGGSLFEALDGLAVGSPPADRYWRAALLRGGWRLPDGPPATGHGLAGTGYGPALPARHEGSRGAPVPEPGTLALLLAGAGLVAARPRRRA